MLILIADKKKKIKKEEGKMASSTIYLMESMEAGSKSSALQPFPWRNYS